MYYFVLLLFGCQYQCNQLCGNGLLSRGMSVESITDVDCADR